MMNMMIMMATVQVQPLPEGWPGAEHCHPHGAVVLIIPHDAGKGRGGGSKAVRVLEQPTPGISTELTT
jgi:hypothetical protein